MATKYPGLAWLFRSPRRASPLPPGLDVGKPVHPSRRLVPRTRTGLHVPREPHCAFALFSDPGRTSVPSLRGAWVMARQNPGFIRQGQCGSPVCRMNPALQWWCQAAPGVRVPRTRECTPLLLHWRGQRDVRADLWQGSTALLPLGRAKEKKPPRSCLCVWSSRADRQYSWPPTGRAGAWPGWSLAPGNSLRPARSAS